MMKEEVIHHKVMSELLREFREKILLVHDEPSFKNMKTTVEQLEAMKNQREKMDQQANLVEEHGAGCGAIQGGRGSWG